MKSLQPEFQINLQHLLCRQHISFENEIELFTTQWLQNEKQTALLAGRNPKSEIDNNSRLEILPDLDAREFQ